MWILLHFQEFTIVLGSMSLGPRFYILALLTLTLATSFSLGECLPSNLDTPGNGCVPSPNICEISCPEDGTCVQTGPDQGCVDALVSNDTINHVDMTEKKCLELCQASDAVGDEDKRCRFWRYVSILHFPTIHDVSTSGSNEQ